MSFPTLNIIKFLQKTKKNCSKILQKNLGLGRDLGIFWPRFIETETLSRVSIEISIGPRGRSLLKTDCLSSSIKNWTPNIWFFIYSFLTFLDIIYWQKNFSGGIGLAEGSLTGKKEFCFRLFSHGISSNFRLKYIYCRSKFESWSFA